MGRSDLTKASSISKIVEDILFCNISYFCCQITFCRPQPTSDDQKWSKNNFSPFYIDILKAESVTIPLVSIPTNLHFKKNSVTERFTTKKSVFCILQCPPAKKKVTPCCEVNFDATDLPHSFEPLYPKVFRGSLKVDLVPIARHTAPPRIISA